AVASLSEPSRRAPAMKTSLPEPARSGLKRRLQHVNAEFAKAYTGEGPDRQPVHTVYGGGHLFRSDLAPKLGANSLRAMQEYAATPADLSEILRVPGAEPLSDEIVGTIHARVLQKLRTEPVEDFRIDFEEGSGNRPDGEEDGHAVAAAAEVAKGMEAGTLPPFIGIRIKPFSDELKDRSIRTMDLFLTALVEASDGRLPANFVVTIPKV